MAQDLKFTEGILIYELPLNLNSQDSPIPLKIKSHSYIFVNLPYLCVSSS